ncbi:TonB-dependent receptor [Algoriphagus lacus]|uniref:TonB-dependent receptor n=1 Tax=Algoriphagus lacus TaxID=2056311 RepID=A0A418PMK8_9BACT|nr:TonB-dependent receptor [Algoriphagus lacus]RIW12788.1 TonB-dependent receptor [Algoriphagus lacus]
MKKILLLFLSVFGLGVQLVIGQQILVTEFGSNQPLAGVLIYSTDPGKSSITDSNGAADISIFKDQTEVIIQLLGFESKKISWENLASANFKIELKPSQITLDIAIVAASRWRQSTQDVPGKVRQLDEEKLFLRNPANSADWLGSSGEVFIQKSQQGGGSPMIRGFSANRLLYAVDGVRMNTAIFRSGNLQNVISLDPFILKSTEILFGPGSVMYGSDAIGGVMAFETLSPDFSKNGLNVKTNALSRFATANDEFTLHADVEFGLKKWAFLSSISRFDYNDLRMGANGPSEYLRTHYAVRENNTDRQIENLDPRLQVQSGYEQLNLMQKIRFQSGEKTDIEYGFHYSNTGNIPRYDRLIEMRNGNLRFASWDYGPQLWVMNNLGLNSSKKTAAYDQVKLKVAHQIFEESRMDRRFGAVELFNRSERINALSLNADFLKNIRKESFLSYGLEAVNNKVESIGKVEKIDTGELDPASSRYPNSNWLSLAVYGTYHAHFSEKIKLQTGARLNYTNLKADFSNNQDFFPLPFNETQNQYNSITGSLGLIYNPEPSLSISPLISTGFRAPNVDDLGKIFDSEPGAVLVPNPDLKPEYAYNFELNLNKHFQNKVKLDFSGFYTLLDQAMVRRPFTLNGQSEILYDGELSEVLALQNAAFAEIYGIQAGLEVALSKRFFLISRYNWQKGTEELDDESTSPSRHAAPAFGLTRLAYQHKKFKMEVTAQYSATRNFEDMPEEEKGKPAIYAVDGNGNPYSPGWTIFNFTSTFQLHKTIQVMAGIENIGDIRYRPYSSGIVAPGRNFTFGIKGSF